MSNLLEKIVNYYITSRDYNGYILNGTDDGTDTVGYKKEIESLIRNGDISLVFDTYGRNPFVQQFDPWDAEDQIKQLYKEDLTDNTKDGPSGCGFSIYFSTATVGAYPTYKHLKLKVKKSKYKDRPYDYRMALGEPQLHHQCFDLTILEQYRNDPRYIFECRDFSGSIMTTGENSDLPEKDQAYLQSFGFGINGEGRRCVVVYLRYLTMLPLGHQAVRKQKEIDGANYIVYQNYHESTCGHRPSKTSIFQACLDEMTHILNMSKNISGVGVLKSDFQKNRPQEFAWLLRPTQKEYNQFIHILDKMFSENLNKEYFRKLGMELEFEENRKNGKVEIKQKGTLGLLDEYLKQYCKKFNINSNETYNLMMSIFKKIRKLRQPTAHAIQDNIYNQEIFKEQRKLIFDFFNSLRLLRSLFALHPINEEYSKNNIEKHLSDPESLVIFY